MLKHLSPLLPKWERDKVGKRSSTFNYSERCSHRNIISQEGQIEEGNTMYEAWSVVTSPAYMSYYFYNVTNAEEFLAQKTGNYVPPVLKELGPYRFRLAKRFSATDKISYGVSRGPSGAELEL